MRERRVALYAPQRTPTDWSEEPKNSADPVVAASAEWINFYDPDDVLAFPLKGLSEHYDAAVDEDRAVSVGALVIGMSPVSHVAYWNDAAVIRPIAQSLAWLWNALRKGIAPVPDTES